MFVCVIFKNVIIISFIFNIKYIFSRHIQLLNIIKRYSPSELKYEKKLTVTYNKINYYFKIYPAELAEYSKSLEIEKQNACIKAGRAGDRLTKGLKQLIEKYNLPQEYFKEYYYAAFSGLFLLIFGKIKRVSQFF